METGTNPDLAKYILAAEVSAIIRQNRLSKFIRGYVKSAWLLAEADIQAENGGGEQKERIDRLTTKLSETPLGERLLGLSDQIRESLKINPEETRRTLTETLSLRKNR